MKYEDVLMRAGGPKVTVVGPVSYGRTTLGIGRPGAADPAASPSSAARKSEPYATSDGDLSLRVTDRRAVRALSGFAESTQPATRISHLRVISHNLDVY
jgi:hypothetical protein